ncbi:MAG: LruC domain-containing protein [bacterium]|nr:LruC domain-containing protein [bacterium]
MKKLIVFLLFFTLFVSACKKSITETPPEAPIVKDPSNIFEMKVPGGFNYQSDVVMDFKIQVLNTQNLPGKNVIFTIETAPSEMGGKLLFKGRVAANGWLEAKIKVPSYLKEIVCNTSLLGIPENVVIAVKPGLQTLNLGGSNPQLVKTFGSDQIFENGMLFKNPAKYSSRYLPLGYNANGVPNNLISPKDVVSNQMINDIWAALPSKQSVAINHPTWLDDNVSKRTLLIKQTADVWVTFLTEGAGFRNTLFYYKYHKNFPPSNLAAIDSLYLVYPNASLANSGGGLLAGDKVFIGRIGADTVIAYGIAANGYDITTGVLSAGQGMYYAHKDFNPENNVSLKQHLVMFFDAASGKYVMGFEDVVRTAAGCDHDFNDVLFYTTSNPISAISNDSIVSLPPSTDTDADGVNDDDDKYPSDAARAFDSYYPGLNQYASVAYEDLWPYYGDYDLNDVVVDFNYHLVTNAQNAVKDVFGKYTLRASGGQIENAFSVEFPGAASNVSSISGASLEAGHVKPVVKVYSNIRSVQPRWNTIPTEPYADSVNVAMNFTFATAVPLVDFGLSEYNPFIYGLTDGHVRGMEIHLPGKTPTALASASYFSTGHDRTSIAQNKYYLSKDNLPWAILTPNKFAYPIEKADVVTAYLKFGQWAQTGGATFADWYLNSLGYRNATKIYVKP